MSSPIFFGVLFLAKVLDNALSTTKTIFIQRFRWLLAGLSVMLSDIIYFSVTKSVVSADSNLAIIIVAVGGGLGCSLACIISEWLSKDRTYVNVIMSDNLDAMKNFRDFLAKHNITNVTSDSYTLDRNFFNSILQIKSKTSLHTVNLMCVLVLLLAICFLLLPESCQCFGNCAEVDIGTIIG